MGEMKALLPWQGTTLLRYQASTLQRAGLSPLVVVLGHRAKELEGQLAGIPGVKPVVNANYAQGRSGSIKAGLSALKPCEAEALLVLGVDQPRRAGTVERVIKERQRLRPLITAPAHRGRGGHPIILSCQLMGELMAISEEEQGLKAVTRRHRGETHWVEMEDDEALLDLNSKEEYLRGFARFGEA